MYCSKCGKENPDNSKFCSDCGTALTNEATRQTEESNVNNKEKTTSKHNYLKYCHNVKKINLLTLISQILSVLVVATIIFVPIYRCEFEADIEDIESVEQFEEALQNDGMISKDFSLYDDIIKIATVFFNTEESDSYNGIVVLYIALFALFQIIFSSCQSSSSSSSNISSKSSNISSLSSTISASPIVYSYCSSLPPLFLTRTLKALCTPSRTIIPCIIMPPP